MNRTLFVFLTKIETFPKRWRGFKYNYLYEICPHCGGVLLTGNLNEKDELCCTFCGNTELLKRYKDSVSVESLKLAKELHKSLQKIAEDHGVTPWELLPCSLFLGLPRKNEDAPQNSTEE